MTSTDRTRKPIGEKAMTEAKQSALLGVGYGRPPVERQWQKGQSGNPKGRPPRQKPADNGAAPREVRDMILDSLRQTHLVSDGKGGEKQISRLEALNLRQQKAALEGNPKALEDVLARAERMIVDEQRELAVMSKNAEACQQLWRQQIDEAKAAGKPAPEFFVHPDDLVIEDGKPIQYMGPVGPDAQAKVKDAVAARDLMIMQAALEDKMFGNDYLKPYRKRRESSMLLAMMLNDRLPERLKLNELAFILAFDRQTLKTKRQLLKEVYAGWRSRGIKASRGATMPPVGEMIDIIEKTNKRVRETVVEQRA